MDNKTQYFIKTNFWTRARMIVPIEADTPEQAEEIFKTGAEAYLGMEIKDIEIEETSTDLEVFRDVMHDLDLDADEETIDKNKLN